MPIDIDIARNILFKTFNPNKKVRPKHIGNTKSYKFKNTSLTLITSLVQLLYNIKALTIPII